MLCSIQSEIWETVFDPSKSWQDKFGAVVNFAFNATMDITTVIGVGEGIKGAYIGAKALLEAGGKVATEEVEHVAEDGAAKLAEEGGNGLEDLAKGCDSFRADTPVATPTGSQAIATLKVGDQVTAYDSKTGKAQPETVQHVFINHDDNLLDVTIADAKPVAATDTKNKQQDAATAAHGSQAPPSRETIHTTTEHPFLTDDRGFVDAVKLVPGEHVTKLDGSLGVVIAVQVVPGQAVRYNLTVQDEHTFAVGQGQWVVHNTFCKVGNSATQYTEKGLKHALRVAKDGGHAADWGVEEGQGIEHMNALADAMEKHIADPATLKLPGWWKGESVWHYANPLTLQNVIVRQATNVMIGGWRLNPLQMINVLSRGFLT